jgi:hypothetical protein
MDGGNDMKSILQAVSTVALVIIAACAVYVVVEHRERQQTSKMSCLENFQAHQFDILNHGGTAAQQDEANAKAIEACRGKQ